MKSKSIGFIVFLLATAFVSFYVAGGIANQTIPPMSESQPTAPLNTSLTPPSGQASEATPASPSPSPVSQPRVAGPMHAIRADYTDMAISRSEVLPLEQEIHNAGLNMVSLSAGRVDWTFFMWAGHLNVWSSDVKNTGIDFLSEDASRFGEWAQVDAAVDALSPIYIRQNPQAAAISWDGKPSTQLVSTMQVVKGQYGQQLLQMIEYIAANYPVDSISINEMFYHLDGYGPDDKAAFMAYTGQPDWPRTSSGSIDINSTTIETWRTYELNNYLSQVHAVCSKYGKQFYFDVPVTLNAQGIPNGGYGVEMNNMFTHVDKIIVWGYFDLDSFPPENLKNTASALTQFNPNRTIFLIGLWNKQGQAVSADKLQQAITAVQDGGLSNIWITPASLMSDAHWNAIAKAWK